MPLPIAGEVNGLAALQHQMGYAVHLIAIRDAAVMRGFYVPCLTKSRTQLAGRRRYLSIKAAISDIAFGDMS